MISCLLALLNKDSGVREEGHLILPPKPSDWLPADAEDLVVIPLLGDFQQFLRSLQTFFDFLLVIKVQRLFVVFHS